jgi:polysaccharide deacetylase 2 family uncharacterized protein YibQ
MARQQGAKKSGAPGVRLRRALLLLSVIAGLLLILVILLPEKKPSAAAGTDRLQGAVGRPERPAGGTSAPAAPERPRPARLAVVIDDVGYNLQDLEPFLRFPGPLSFAVLPRLPHSREAAAMIRAAGRELLLHCPMEPVNGENSGPGTLQSGQPGEILREELALNLDSVPGALGVNNHMGSRFTADEQAMRAVMSSLKERGLFYLDSRTTADSVCRSLAEEYGIPFLSRDIFLDNERSADYIRSAVLEGMKIAERRGYAVLIGHVYSPGIIEVLNALAGEVESWRLASLTELLAWRQEEQEAGEP